MRNWDYWLIEKHNVRMMEGRLEEVLSMYLTIEKLFSLLWRTVEEELAVVKKAL